MLACTFVRSFAQSASSNRECAVTGFLAGTMRMRHIHAVATTAFRYALSILISASASKKNGQLTDQARPGCRTALCTALVCPSRSRLIIARKKLHHIRFSTAMPPPQRAHEVKIANCTVQSPPSQWGNWATGLALTCSRDSPPRRCLGGTTISLSQSAASLAAAEAGRGRGGCQAEETARCQSDYRHHRGWRRHRRR